MNFKHNSLLDTVFPPELCIDIDAVPQAELTPEMLERAARTEAASNRRQNRISARNYGCVIGNSILRTANIDK